MNYDIHFYRKSKKSIEDFKKALLYLLPNQKDSIISICKIKKRLVYLTVSDDLISIDKSGTLNITFDDDEIVKIIEILKHINDNSYVIELKNLIEYSEFKNLNESLKINDSLSDNICYNYVIATDNVYYIVSYFSYSRFFYNLKTIDLQTYIRSIKLKQLL